MCTNRLFSISVYLCLSQNLHLLLCRGYFPLRVCVNVSVCVHVSGLPEHVSPRRALTAPNQPPRLLFPFLFQPADALIEKGASVSR